MPVTVNLVASETARHATNVAISELFDPIAETPLLTSKERIGMLAQLDPEFKQYQRDLPIGFKNVLRAELDSDGSKAASILDKREVADLGGLAISEDFDFWRQSISDQMTFNDDLYPTGIAMSRYKASGALQFGAPATTWHRTFEFAPEDSVLAVQVQQVQRVRGKVVKIPHLFTYNTKLGVIACEMNEEDLLIGSQTDAERADARMQSLTLLLKLMKQGAKQS